MGKVALVIEGKLTKHGCIYMSDKRKRGNEKEKEGEKMERNRMRRRKRRKSRKLERPPICV
jgi:hypothetical protein